MFANESVSADGLGAITHKNTNTDSSISITGRLKGDKRKDGENRWYERNENEN
jgi:hypothetical protein